MCFRLLQSGPYSLTLRGLPWHFCGPQTQHRTPGVDQSARMGFQLLSWLLLFWPWFQDCIWPLKIIISTCATFWIVTVVKELCQSAFYMLRHLIFTTILRWVLLLYFLDARTLLIARHTISSISAFAGEREEGKCHQKCHSHVTVWKVNIFVCVFGDGNRK